MRFFCLIFLAACGPMADEMVVCPGAPNMSCVAASLGYRYENNNLYLPCGRVVPVQIVDSITEAGDTSNMVGEFASTELIEFYGGGQRVVFKDERIFLVKDSPNWVMYHEIGHVMGLSHKPDPSQIMYKEYLHQAPLKFLVNELLSQIHEKGLDACNGN